MKDKMKKKINNKKYLSGPEILKVMNISWSEKMFNETKEDYKKVSRVIPEIEWSIFAPYIQAINILKKDMNAVILAHNYQTPEIFQCGVHFMAETSKLLNMDKTVLIPSMDAGCSLAESITGEDVKKIKSENPNIPVVTYVNTSAEVKAESDICCTSSNALDIVNSLESEEVIFLPDEFLAMNVAKETKKKIIMWKGRCEVHEEFTPEEIIEFRENEPGVKVIAHPECSPDVLEVSDFSGSTSAMINWVKNNQPKKVLMVTECSMSDNISVENPNVNFVRPCNLCPHMKTINLENILESLWNKQHEIIIDPEIAIKAKQAVNKMIEL
jgi:quinolinate synthase